MQRRVPAGHPVTADGEPWLAKHTARSQFFDALSEEHLAPRGVDSAAWPADAPASKSAFAFASRDSCESPHEQVHTRDNERPYSDGNGSTRTEN